MTDGSSISTYARYNTLFEAGSSFRVVVNFGYPAGIPGEVFILHFGDDAFNEWISVQFLSYLNPQVCFVEVRTVQLACFVSISALYFSPTPFHEFTFEYHNPTNQVFVFVDKSTNPIPIGQWTVVQPQPHNTSLFLRAYSGGGGTIPWSSMVINSLSVNTETFVPTPVTNSAFKRPLQSPLKAYSTTNFTSSNGWANGPSVLENPDGSIFHQIYQAGVSWLVNPVSISSSCQADFTFKFDPNGASKYGLIFVIQNLGVNIGGAVGGFFGFATWDGWGLAISPDKNVYLYNSFQISSLEFGPIPNYPKQPCLDISLNAFLTVSLSIDLYQGTVSGAITNQNSNSSCLFDFSFDTCTATKAYDPLSRSAWIGFTSSYLPLPGQFPHETITSLNFTSKL